ncbi:MAG: YggT family protein [Bacilli bacterium]
MLYTIFNLISQLLYIYSYVLIIYVLMSWFPGSRDTGFGRFVAALSEPYLDPFRRIIPPLGFIDISPIVAFFVLRFAPEGLWAIYSFLA